MLIYAATEQCSQLARYTIECCNKLGFNSVVLNGPNPAFNEWLVPVVPIFSAFPGGRFMSTRMADYEGKLPFLNWAPEARLMLVMNQNFENVSFLRREPQREEFMEALRISNQELEEQAKAGLDSLPRLISDEKYQEILSGTKKPKQVRTTW